MWMNCTLKEEVRGNKKCMATKNSAAQTKWPRALIRGTFGFFIFHHVWEREQLSLPCCGIWWIRRGRRGKRHATGRPSCYKAKWAKDIWEMMRLSDKEGLRRRHTSKSWCLSWERQRNHMNAVDMFSVIVNVNENAAILIVKWLCTMEKQYFEHYVLFLPIHPPKSCTLDL